VRWGTGSSAEGSTEHLGAKRKRPALRDGLRRNTPVGGVAGITRLCAEPIYSDRRSVSGREQRKLGLPGEQGAALWDLAQRSKRRNFAPGPSWAYPQDPAGPAGRGPQAVFALRPNLLANRGERQVRPTLGSSTPSVECVGKMGPSPGLAPSRPHSQTQVSGQKIPDSARWEWIDTARGER